MFCGKIVEAGEDCGSGTVGTAAAFGAIFDGCLPFMTEGVFPPDFSGGSGGEVGWSGGEISV